MSHEQAFTTMMKNQWGCFTANTQLACSQVSREAQQCCALLIGTVLGRDISEVRHGMPPMLFGRLNSAVKGRYRDLADIRAMSAKSWYVELSCGVGKMYGPFGSRMSAAKWAAKAVELPDDCSCEHWRHFMGPRVGCKCDRLCYAAETIWACNVRVVSHCYFGLAV